MKNDFRVVFEEQRWSRIEGWIIKDNKQRIRLDFLLEYYISNNVELSKKIKGKIKNNSIMKEYSIKLFEKFMKFTDNGLNFNFEDYIKWQKTDNLETQKILNLINN